ncbi:hypothetical protein KOI35_29940 [Actinoplanes bogorensis]|uniref:CofH/MqnC-like C-terminal domain-containing protein n=1 Tax=Paractinoplanes bogorensis TaxID=1610840 RepID=A0ABS5YWP8_9ACTN|nr:hypothetical protein [Actinoplanes bogorensis]MBU2667741.1 hypothetical protein [Actinoplanes bogorensis]
MDAGLKRELEAKVYAGERLSRADGEVLYASDDLAWLGRLAHHRRTELNGDRVMFAAADDDAENVATMIFGQGEEPAQRVDQILRLRETQDETGGFAAFIPLRHQDDATMAAPAESLKTFAVSRLLFDNVAHVTCVWTTLGLSVAQLTLNFGADDLVGPLSDDAGPPDSVQRADLLELIWDAGFQPVGRDARYHVVREHDRAPSLAERRREPQKVWA